MSVMPSPDEERAIPQGERVKVEGGLEVQLATIHGTESVDASLGGHGFMVPMDTQNPAIIVFQKGGYAGHYTLPEEIAWREIPELLKTDYVRGILDKYRK